MEVELWKTVAEAYVIGMTVECMCVVCMVNFIFRLHRCFFRRYSNRNIMTLVILLLFKKYS